MNSSAVIIVISFPLQTKAIDIHGTAENNKICSMKFLFEWTLLFQRIKIAKAQPKIK